MAEPPFGSGLPHRLDRQDCLQAPRQRKEHKQDCHLCVGLKQNVLKEVLGMWVGKSENSAFWMDVLANLNARGVQDILITSDYLNGFTDIIRAVFSQSSTQICVVHRIRNSFYAILSEIEKKWTQPIHNWELIMNQLILIFENRIQI